MTLLEQCRAWLQSGEPQRAVDAIEALSGGERSGELLLVLEEARQALRKPVPSLLGEEELAVLESFDDGNSGYFYRLLDYLSDFIRTGVSEKRFTEEEARADLQIALWFSFGCLNIDEYEFYYRAAEWMPSSERNARGCGAWYYRYSVALMYCGRLTEARDYAEAGVREEPDYPWIWLQAAKLRSHFGDKEGAENAVEQGLSLAPDDHEFLTLRDELERGATLEEMEYHWIDPEADRRLQLGLDMDDESKRRAISCITTDEAGLAAFSELFSLSPADWKERAPYCRILYSAPAGPVELVFRMNEAALSKRDRAWLHTQKERIDSGRWFHGSAEDGSPVVLDTILFDLDDSVSLIYRRTNAELYFQIPVDENGEPEGEADDAREPENGRAPSSFSGYVLLSEPQWSKAQLIRTLWEEWGIDAREDSGSGDDSLLFYAGGMIVTVSLTAAPFSDQELELQAADNDVWTDALDVAAMHQAYLTATVFGSDAEPLELALLHTKLIAGCCRQESAVAVSSNEILFAPDIYLRLANMIRRDQLPVFNWVWFGISCRGNGVCGFTRGMRFFGKDELEVLDSCADLCEVQNILRTAAVQILTEDARPADGDRLELPDFGGVSVSRGEGVFARGMSLKLPFSPQESCSCTERQSAGPELYTRDEIDALEEHIASHFGRVEKILHEIASPDIHVDLCVIPPDGDRDYDTLVTLGMGAHRMNIPDPLSDYKLRRAELLIALPRGWRYDDKDERWYWPIRLLKTLARLPGETDSWLGWGHTVENGKPFADNTRLCAALLVAPQGIGDEGDVCYLPDGSGVNFYQIIPLHQEELEYKIAHSTEELLDRMEGVSFVVDPARPAAVDSESWQEMVVDDADCYLTVLREKQLPLADSAAFTHMAFYLRWCISRGLMSDEFLLRQEEMVRRLASSPQSVDLRQFLREELSGLLLLPLFSEEGQAFTLCYYDEWSSPSYLGDVEEYALSRVDPAVFPSDEARQAAYLFLPCDEETYRAVAERIDARWREWVSLADQTPEENEPAEP